MPGVILDAKLRLIDWLIQLRFHVPSVTKQVISETFFPASLLT